MTEQAEQAEQAEGPGQRQVQVQEHDRSDQEPLSGLANLRREYDHGALNEEDVSADPFEQFARWFQDALDALGAEANAMALATASAAGLPSARMVLLKGFDQQGFAFYTNYESEKGRNLLENPHAALLFYWGKLSRQVRVVGAVSRLTAEESAAYFHSRPRGSQIGAVASAQSRVIPHREALEARVQELERRYAAEEGESQVPLPDYWGGFRLRPASFEFWQGRLNRLHDRLRYRPTDDGAWVIERLAP